MCTMKIMQVNTDVTIIPDCSVSVNTDVRSFTDILPHYFNIPHDSLSMVFLL